MFALMVGLAAGFFFGRAGALTVRNPPLGLAAPSAERGQAPVPTPMANPGPRPTWKARIEPMPDATDRRRCLDGLTEADIEEWRRLHLAKPADSSR